MKTAIRYTEIMALALPIYGGLFATTLVGIVDTAFLGRVSTMQQSAVGYGALFYLVFFVIGMGFTLGTQILIARRMGEGRPEKVGPIFWNGIFFMLAYSTLVCIFFNTGIHSFFNAFTKSETISLLTADYLRQRSFGIYGTMLNLCFIAFYVGKGKSLAISLSAILSSFLNIVLGYALVFGKFGFERMEIRGAAIAAGIAELSGTAAFIFFTVFQKDLKKLNLLSSIRFQKEQLRDILHISSPLILQNMISIFSWFLFFTIIEKTGEKNFGISIIIRSIYSIFMIGPISLASACNSMVSNLIGQQRENEVMPLIRKIVLFSLLFMLFTLVFLALFPDAIFMIFTRDTVLVQQAMPTVYTLILALVVFSVANIIFQSVSGTGKTRVALALEVSSIAIYLGYTIMASYLLTHRLHLIWMAEVVYMFFFGLVSYLYMRSGRWKGTKI